jgi:hypothetical protein
MVSSNIDRRAEAFGVRTDRRLGDDSVFDDLKISKKEYSEVPTTW